MADDAARSGVADDAARSGGADDAVRLGGADDAARSGVAVSYDVTYSWHRFSNSKLV